MLKVEEITQIVRGRLVGDGSIFVKGIATKDIAREGDITFAFNEKDLEKANESHASCILTVAEGKGISKTVIIVSDIKKASTIIYNALQKYSILEQCSIHPSAVISDRAYVSGNVFIDSNVKVGDNTHISEKTSIGSNCVFGRNIKIGKGVIFYPNVTIYDNTIVGDNVIVHSGAVIGADGFGYIKEEGNVYKVPQLGRVVIEDDVEIGANTCIDRGVFEDVVIGKGTKIDNLVQVAHNVRIGENVMIAAQSGIAGSSVVGDNTLIGGQVGIADHVHIGKNVKIGAKTGVTGNVKNDETVFGYPHRKVTEARKIHGLLFLMIKNEKRFRELLRVKTQDMPER